MMIKRLHGISKRNKAVIGQKGFIHVKKAVSKPGTARQKYQGDVRGQTSAVPIIPVGKRAVLQIGGA